MTRACRCPSCRFPYCAADPLHALPIHDAPHQSFSCPADPICPFQSPSKRKSHQSNPLEASPVLPLAPALRPADAPHAQPIPPPPPESPAARRSRQVNLFAMPHQYCLLRPAWDPSPACPGSRRSTGVVPGGGRAPTGRAPGATSSRGGPRHAACTWEGVEGCGGCGGVEVRGGSRMQGCVRGGHVVEARPLLHCLKSRSESAHFRVGSRSDIVRFQTKHQRNGDVER